MQLAVSAVGSAAPQSVACGSRGLMDAGWRLPLACSRHRRRERILRQWESTQMRSDRDGPRQKLYVAVFGQRFF